MVTQHNVFRMSRKASLGIMREVSTTRGLDVDVYWMLEQKAGIQADARSVLVIITDHHHN